jgi:hypothetical protein
MLKLTFCHPIPIILIFIREKGGSKKGFSLSARKADLKKGFQHLVVVLVVVVVVVVGGGGGTRVKKSF